MQYITNVLNTKTIKFDYSKSLNTLKRESSLLVKTFFCKKSLDQSGTLYFHAVQGNFNLAQSGTIKFPTGQDFKILTSQEL